MSDWGSPYLAGQAAYLRHLGTSAVAETIEHEGLYAVRTRVRSNTENGVVGVARDARDVDRLIAWFAEWQVPAAWLCDDGPRLTRTAALLRSAGCVPERGATEMRAELASLPREIRSTRGIPVDVVMSEEALEAWLDVASGCGWFDDASERDAARELYLSLAFERDARLRLYLGLDDGGPVAMAAAFYSPPIVVLTALGVIESRRRQGFGSALAQRRLREARERGCELAVLAPSPDGRGLYAALGFETCPQPADRWYYLPVDGDAVASAEAR